MTTPVTSIEACSTIKDDQKPHSIHILPARLDYTGQSNISSFFPQRCDSDGWTSFRGHAIQPFKIETPSGFQLNVVKKKEDSKDYIVEETKSPIISWERDLVTPYSSNLQKSLNFLKVAEALAAED